MPIGGALSPVGSPPSCGVKVVCRMVAQQHKNIGVSSFFIRGKVFGRTSRGKKKLFFSFIYFLKGERENELQAKKREEVTNEKNGAWISRSDPSNASTECVKGGANLDTCTGVNCPRPF